MIALMISILLNVILGYFLVKKEFSLQDKQGELNSAKNKETYFKIMADNIDDVDDMPGGEQSHPDTWKDK